MPKRADRDMMLEQLTRIVKRNRDLLVRDRIKGRDMIARLSHLLGPAEQILLRAAERKMRAAAKIILLYDEFLADPQRAGTRAFIDELIKTDEETRQMAEANKRILRQYHEEDDTDA